jgi:undecaprenyl diphosphate synthase
VFGGNIDVLDVVPKHVAIIMDGNGRWAESRGLSRIEGHRAGAQNLDVILDAAIKIGVSYITVYAFSSENWKRPDSEVRGLMVLLAENLRIRSDSLNVRDIRLRHIGRLERLPTELQNIILEIVETTKNNTGLAVSLAFDYGGRQEILEATQAIIRDAVPGDSVDSDLFQRYLYTVGIPDPDLIIRTAGEQRISNFLLWQSAYSEYYAADCYWPDFDGQEFVKAIVAFQSRQRRYGGLQSLE